MRATRKTGKKQKKSPNQSAALIGALTRNRRRPTLPHSHPCSTIGAKELNFRVRNGNGWILFAMATEKSVELHVYQIDLHITNILLSCSA